MAKTKTAFVCQTCGAKSPKWLGKCPGCGGWNTLVEEMEERADARPAWGSSSNQARPVPLNEVRVEGESRRLTAISELDRVLGGGVAISRPGVPVCVHGHASRGSGPELSASCS